MKIPLYQIDAFTAKPFQGNPAAVCPLVEWLDDSILQQIAAENNLSETAFFVRTGDIFHIRWFTPTVEVELCGHATLAAAFVIFNYLDFPRAEIEFTSLGGKLAVTRDSELLCLDFPVTPPQPITTPSELVSALRQFPSETLKSRDILAVFESEADIVSLKPDFTALAQLDCLGIIVTAPGTESDFVSRFFAPSVGINEDPVTGSAHTTLIPFWANRLQKNKLHAFQLSARKGEIWGEDSGDRVKISGQAVTYLKGEIELA